MSQCGVFCQLPTFGIRGRGRQFKKGAELDSFDAWAKREGRRASCAGYARYVDRYNAQVHGILPPSAKDLSDGSGASVDEDGEGSIMEISDGDAAGDRDEVRNHLCSLPEWRILTYFGAPPPSPPNIPTPSLSYGYKKVILLRWRMTIPRMDK
jgi:hypothetical protein